MRDPSIFIRLIGDSDHYDLGDTLSGEFFIDTDDPESIRAVEISVLWYTEGKGEEDLDVHFFKRIGNDNGDFIDMRQSQAFSTALPASPLSYDGVIVKIFWCVRIRAFLKGGRDFSSEQSFWLGRVPRGQAIEVDEEPLAQDTEQQQQTGEKPE